MFLRLFFLRRLKSGVIDSLPVLGLLLWLGLIGAAWISLGGAGKNADEHGIGSTPAAPAPEAQRAARQPSSEPSEPPRHTPAQSAVAEAPTQDDEGMPTAPKTRPAPKQEPKKPNPSRLAAAEPPASKHLARALFTSGVENNEPVDRLGGVFHSRGQAIRTLYYFTDLRGLRGERIVYRWRHGDRVIAKVSFRVRADQFRAYSSKRLTRAMTGRWTVTLTNSAGDILSKARIVYETP